jgi:hypothetical protein
MGKARVEGDVARSLVYRREAARAALEAVADAVQELDSGCEAASKARMPVPRGDRREEEECEE